MADVSFNNGMEQILKGAIDFSSDDIRIALLMTNTTPDADDNVPNDIATLDEFDGANYVRKALASETVTQDDANNRAEFDAADVTFSSLGAGTRAIEGILIYKHVGTDANHILLFWKELGSTFTPSGNDVILNWDTQGILQLSK